MPLQGSELSVFKTLERAISVVFIHPHLTADIFKSAFRKAKAVVLQCYGMGNFPMQRQDLVEIIEDALGTNTNNKNSKFFKKDSVPKTVVLVSQCKSGFVRSSYASSVELKKKGVILAEDMTIECVIAKLSYILGKGYEANDVKGKMLENLRGEISPNKDIWEVEQDDPFFNEECKNSSLTGENLSFSSLNNVSNILQPLVTGKLSSSFDLFEALTPKSKSIRTFVDLNQINTQDKNGLTALHKAVLQNNDDQVQYLWNQEKIDVNIIDKRGNSPLFYACQNGNQKIVHLLKFEGAVVATPVGTLTKVLAEKAQIGDLGSLKLFHRCGVDMNVLNDNGENLAHSAALAHQHNVLIYLAKCCDISLFTWGVKAQKGSVIDRISDINCQQKIRQIITSRTS